MVGLSRPAAAFYPDRESNDDPTNWWGPNHAAVAGMLRSVGFVTGRRDHSAEVCAISGCAGRQALADRQEHPVPCVQTGSSRLPCLQSGQLKHAARQHYLSVPMSAVPPRFERPAGECQVALIIEPPRRFGSHAHRRHQRIASVIATDRSSVLHYDNRQRKDVNDGAKDGSESLPTQRRRPRRDLLDHEYRRQTPIHFQEGTTDAQLLGKPDRVGRDRHRDLGERGHRQCSGQERHHILRPASRDPAPGSKKQAFRTIGITTVAKTTIAGPPPGVQQTYKTVALRGSAQQVTF